LCDNLVYVLKEGAVGFYIKLLGEYQADAVAVEATRADIDVGNAEEMTKEIFDDNCNGNKDGEGREPPVLRLRTGLSGGKHDSKGVVVSGYIGWKSGVELLSARKAFEKRASGRGEQATIYTKSKTGAEYLSLEVTGTTASLLVRRQRAQRLE